MVNCGSIFIKFDMNTDSDDRQLKLSAAQAALALVKSGMQIGLGSGSTAGLFVELLGEMLKSGRLKDIQAVPTSDQTARRAEELRIPLISLTQAGKLDLAIDGADEVDPELNLIKGLGKALLREKIIVINARKFIVVVDETKLVPQLGSRGPLPVEILPFEAGVHIRWLNTLGCRAVLWEDEQGAPYLTDNGNYLARCWFTPAIPEPLRLAEQLERRPGIIEHGLFLGMATEVIVAGKSGIEHLHRGR